MCMVEMHQVIVRVSECCQHHHRVTHSRTFVTHSMQSTVRKQMDKLMNVVMELRKVSLFYVTSTSIHITTWADDGCICARIMVLSQVCNHPEISCERWAEAPLQFTAQVLV